MAITYPDAWKVLSNPQGRFELLDKLDELARAERSALWLTTGSQTAGVAESLKFFLQNHALDRSAIGASLFDDREAVAVQLVKNALAAIFKTNSRGDDRYFLKHRGWKTVQSAALSAHQIMIANDVARSG